MFFRELRSQNKLDLLELSIRIHQKNNNIGIRLCFVCTIFNYVFRYKRKDKSYKGSKKFTTPHFEIQ